MQSGEMGDQARLGGLVVIRRHDQRCFGADLFGMADQVDPLCRVVRPRPGNHRNPACGGANDFFDDLTMFRMSDGRAFAGGAHRNKAAGALFDMPLHELIKRHHIQGAVLERRDQSREGPFEHGNVSSFGG